MTEIENIEDNHNVNKMNAVNLEKLTFDNVYGELEYYKKKCEVLEKDLFKSQTQNKKLEINLKKTQEINSVYGKNVNNTSISFLLPSEFKTLWESFCKDLLLEAFDCLYDDFFNLSHVTNDLLKITYEETKEVIRDKVNSVLKVLNVRYNQLEKSSNTNPEEKFHLLFKSIFQEYFSQIFEFTDVLLEKIKKRLIDQVKEYQNRNIEDIFDDLVVEINKKPFITLMQSLFKLCIYMLLHDPVLTFDIDKYGERKLNYMFYNKNNFLNIEGFGNDDTPCVVIVPPPLINNKHVYLGIKPAVYCIQKSLVSQEILTECEKNKVATTNHKHTNSIVEVSTLQHNTNSEIMGENKFNVTPVKVTIQKTPLKHNTNKGNSNNSTIIVSKQNQTVSNNFDRDNPVKENEINLLKDVNIEKDKSIIGEDLFKTEKSKIIILSIETIELADKKYYDRPLAFKGKIQDEIHIQPRNKFSSKASFISQDNNTYTVTPSRVSTIKSVIHKNSIESSIHDSLDHNESKSIINNSGSQIGQNHTKSSRSNNTLTPYSNNIPIPNGTKNIINDKGFDVIRSKTLNQNYNEEKIIIKKNETSKYSNTNNKNNLTQKDVKFSSNIKGESLMNLKESKARIAETYDDDANKLKSDLNPDNLYNYDKPYVAKTFSPSKKIKIPHNEFAYTNINNISRKNMNSEKLNNDKFNSLTVNLSSLNRLTPKENKIESRFDKNSNIVYDNLNKKMQSNVKPLDDKVGKYSFTSKINRIGDSTRSDDERLSNNNINSKYTGINKDSTNSVTSKLQKLEIDRLIGNSKYPTGKDVKNKTQKFYNSILNSQLTNQDKNGLLSSNKNIGFYYVHEKK